MILQDIWTESPPHLLAYARCIVHLYHMDRDLVLDEPLVDLRGIARYEILNIVKVKFSFNGIECGEVKIIILSFSTHWPYRTISISVCKKAN